MVLYNGVWICFWLNGRVVLFLFSSSSPTECTRLPRELREVSFYLLKFSIHKQIISTIFKVTFYQNLIFMWASKCCISANLAAWRVWKVLKDSSRVVFFDPLLNLKTTLSTMWYLFLNEATYVLNMIKNGIEEKNKKIFRNEILEDLEEKMLRKVNVY